MRDEWYRYWFDSDYYHKLYWNHDDEEARGFVLRLLEHLQPAPGSRLLDAACGRGRHARVMASRGYDVTGFDLSFKNISFAQQGAPDNLQFFQHDLRLPAWINYFDYVFNLYTSFGFFASRREHEDGIRMLAQSVRWGGTLVLDYLNVHYAEEHLVANETKDIGDTRFTIHRWDNPTHFFKRIEIKDKLLDGPIQFTEKVTKLSLGDFTEMLAFNGVQVQEVFGSDKLEPYHLHHSPRMIIVGQKQIKGV